MRLPGLAAKLLLPGLFVMATAWPAHAQPSAAAGEYFCVSGGTCPCDRDTMLQLSRNGNWRMGTQAGTYRVDEQKVLFTGTGDIPTWGAAAMGPRTLTFNTGSSPIVCWQRGGAAAADDAKKNDH